MFSVKKIALNNPDLLIIYPVHLNPNVQKPVYSFLNYIGNIHLIEPQDYESFVFLLNKSYLVLTDSGGIQEEAPSLGKPVLVMRNNTERPEGVEAGTAKLVGTDPESIIGSVDTLLSDSGEYKRMAHVENPYGDGRASEKIFNSLVSLIA